MRVLWFEVCIPQNYIGSKEPLGGWQDSLESLVKKYCSIELGIAFEGSKNFKPKNIDGVEYFPINIEYNKIEKYQNIYTCDITRNKILPEAIKIINYFKPDIIHVFGSEWCWGQVAKYTNIPVVIHMQGSIPPYYNALYPPNYNIYDRYIHNGFNIKKSFYNYLENLKMKSWKQQEEETLRIVPNFMGRTEWDKAIVKLYNPNAKYYYCSEALRDVFYANKGRWKPQDNPQIRLISTGCGSFWKGIDTIIRTAKLLKDQNIDFEWRIAGKMPMKKLIEKKEKLKFTEQNIKILGYLNAESLTKELLISDLYIHTAYIDNSPNAICEAQLLGIPIIATYVGGIPSLITNKEDGELIPSNDPYTLACSIIRLAKDKEKRILYSKNSTNKAVDRHNPITIINDLLNCYNSILNS